MNFEKDISDHLGKTILELFRDFWKTVIPILLLL